MAASPIPQCPPTACRPECNDRLIRLVLTLPVTTATTERAFSAMKLIKTRLRSKIGDDFLRDCLILYIEKEIAIKFTTESLIDGSWDMKSCRVRLKWKMLVSLNLFFMYCFYESDYAFVYLNVLWVYIHSEYLMKYTHRIRIYNILCWSGLVGPPPYSEFLAPPLMTGWDLKSK